jgi:hypothetical protein
MMIHSSVSPRRMIGKNVSIRATHEEWCMQQAAKNGVNFSEVIRAAIDHVMQEDEDGVQNSHVRKNDSGRT